jgi:hypothetical protein
LVQQREKGRGGRTHADVPDFAQRVALVGGEHLRRPIDDVHAPAYGAFGTRRGNVVRRGVVRIGQHTAKQRVQFGLGKHIAH